MMDVVGKCYKGRVTESSHNEYADQAFIAWPVPAIIISAFPGVWATL